MAELNPSIQTKEASSFLNYSKGVEVDTRGSSTSAKAISGAGDLLTLANKAATNLYEERIRNEANDQIDQARAEFGVDAGVAMQDPVGANRTPEEISRAGEQLDRMKRAAAQGKLQESHYQLRVESISRQLRAKYPGHRDEIDGIVSKINGGNPANAARRALMSEAAESASTAQAAANRWENFVYSAVKDGRLPGDFANAALQGKLSRDQVVKIVADSEYQDKSVSRETAALAMRKARGEAVEKATGDMLVQQAQELVGTTTNNYLSPLGADSKALDALVAKMQAPGAKVTPEDTAELGSLLNRAKTNAEARLNQFVTTGLVNKLVFSPDHMKKAKEVLDLHFNRYQEALANKDWGFFSADKRLYEAKSENGKLNYINKDEFIARSAALKNVMGENTYNATLGQDANILSTHTRVNRDWMLGGLATGKYRTMADSLNDIKGLAKDEASYADAAKSGVNAAIKMMTAPDTRPEAVRNVASAMFSSTEGSILGLEKNPTKRGETFAKLANPAVTARMADLRKQPGGEDLWKNYKNWVESSTYTYGTKTLSDLRYELENTKGYTVSYDPDTQGFAYARTPIRGAEAGRVQGNMGFTMSPTGPADETRIRAVVADLNRFANPLVGIAKIEGTDANAQVDKYTRMVGIDLQTLATKPLYPETQKQQGRMPVGAKDLAAKDSPDLNEPNFRVVSDELTAEEKQRIADEEAVASNNKVERDRNAKIRSGEFNFDALFKAAQDPQDSVGDVLRGYQALTPEQRKQLDDLYAKRK